MGTAGVAHPALPTIRIAVVEAVAVGAAKEPHQWIRPTGEATPAAVAGPPAPPQLRDACEERRVNGRLERRRAFLLIGSALVADRPAGIEGVGEDLSESGVAEAELVGERRVAPGAGRIEAERAPDAIAHLGSRV